VQVQVEESQVPLLQTQLFLFWALRVVLAVEQLLATVVVLATHLFPLKE
jgi:hypothetical protein